MVLCSRSNSEADGITEEILMEPAMSSEFDDHPSGHMSWQEDEVSAGSTSEQPVPDSQEPVVLKTYAEIPEVLPPNATRWKIRTTMDGYCLASRGRWTFQGLGVLFLLNLFWNGVVVLVSWEALLKPGIERFNIDWLMKAAFLSIFGMIGLFLLLLLILELVEPFHTRTWEYNSVLIVCRLAWFGIGYTWAYPRQRLARIDVTYTPQDEAPDGKSRKRHRTSSRNSRQLEPYEKASRIFTLALISENDEVVCTWEGLNLEECDVIGPTLLWMDRHLS